MASMASALNTYTYTYTSPLRLPNPNSSLPLFSHSLPHLISTTTKHSHKALSISAISTAPTVETTQHNSPSKPPKTLPFRVGHGFDLHRLEPGYPLIIGGIDIPHDRGCEAHSDGDVLLHCVVDAILGALGLPDIGQIFPDNDPKWKGAASSVFIKEAVGRNGGVHEGSNATSQ